MTVIWTQAQSYNSFLDCQLPAAASKNRLPSKLANMAQKIKDVAASVKDKIVGHGKEV